MDLHRAELLIDHEVADRIRSAEKFQVHLNAPATDLIASAVAASLGHMLVRAGMRLETLADHCLPDDSLLMVNPDPCNGCAN
jgi:hypothetical protein